LRTVRREPSGVAREYYHPRAGPQSLIEVAKTFDEPAAEKASSARKQDSIAAHLQNLPFIPGKELGRNATVPRLG
jgi:hypothetical protein